MRNVVFIGTLCCVFSGIASAAIMNDNPPAWRGDDFTTHQAWAFDNDNSPADLDVDFNPFGPPMAEIVGIDPPFGPPDFNAPNTYWKAVDNGHEGVWRLYGESFMRFFIPNNPRENDTKIIQLQLTYRAGGQVGAEPEIFTYPDNVSMVLQDKVQLDNYYYHAIWEIIIKPNPDIEWLAITPQDNLIYIDEAIIDTICIPEPITLCLFGLGGLMLRKKRRV
ncbi:MAG: PEP-CTERM sorting domain-containing protein [Phycisphaerae bacterium]|nr:PEP-CTERM sorting domain-containing protein [Phycisphaerae bacterium]